MIRAGGAALGVIEEKLDASAADFLAVAGTLGQAAAGLTLLQGGQAWAISA